MLPGSGSEKWDSVSFPILHTRLTKRLLTENPVTRERIPNGGEDGASDRRTESSGEQQRRYSHDVGQRLRSSDSEVVYAGARD